MDVYALNLSLNANKVFPFLTYNLFFPLLFYFFFTSFSRPSQPAEFGGDGGGTIGEVWGGRQCVRGERRQSVGRQGVWEGGASANRGAAGSVGGGTSTERRATGSVGGSSPAKLGAAIVGGGGGEWSCGTLASSSAKGQYP